MRGDVRAAALTLLDGYKSANPGSLRHTFHARPATISPPAGFVDAIDEPEITWTNAGMQRTPLVRIRLVRGTFSSGDVAEANDDLVDGFIEYARANFHAAGANTIVVVTAAEDDDGWIPEWIPESQPYYSTLVTLSGEGLFGGLV
jgi:hypothetical protein